MADSPKSPFIQRITRQKGAPATPGDFSEAQELRTISIDSIAVDLRQARQDMGRDLGLIAQDLKIRRVYLQAIEEGRFDDLPGATYAVGFIRAYADYLRLDGVEIVNRFKGEVEGLNERQHMVFPTPVPESKIPSGAVLLISILLIALAYGGWYYLSGRDLSFGEQILEVPESLEKAVSGGVQAPAEGLTNDPPEVRPQDTAQGSSQEPGPADQVTVPVPSEPTDMDEPAAESAGETNMQAGEPAPPEGENTAEPSQAEETGPQATQEPPGDGNGDSSDVEMEPAAEVTLETSSAVAATQVSMGPGIGTIPTAPTPELLSPSDAGRAPQVYGVENESARIVLRATLDSWVQVHAADESLLMTRVLQPGDSYRVPDLAGLTLVTGNAGGLQIEVDGTALAPVGPVGAVRRGIALDPQRLLDGTAMVQ